VAVRIYSLGSSARKALAGTPKAPTRILVADDSGLAREQLRFLLESNPDWEVCGEAADGHEAVEKARQLRPDLVVLDFSMPYMNGFQAAEGIAAEHPHTPLLLFSTFLSRQVVEEARRRGFRGAIAKADASRYLLPGVETLLKHQEFFPRKFQAS
jgi:DNA-binding NarL/FixJ family response regulator